MRITKVAACLMILSGTAATAAVLADRGDEAPPRTEQAAEIRVAPPKALMISGRARLGISIREVTGEDVTSARLTSPAGAVVESVTEGSAAEAGGLRKGDIIVEFDGERVRSARMLTRLVQETADGRKVPTVVVREGQRVTLTVAPSEGSGGFESLRDLADWGRNFRVDVPRLARPVVPEPRARAKPPSVFRFEDMFGGGGRLGITIDDLSPQLADYFGTKDGVLVTSVRDDSVAAKAGIRAGDVITSFNGSAINDPADLRRRIQPMNAGDEFTIEVMRERKPQTLNGKLEGTSEQRTYRSIV